MNLDTRFFQLLEKELGELQEQLAVELVTGKASDWPDYKWRVGKLKGVRDALSVASEINKRVIGLDEKKER
jgi:hypothetical protein